MKVIRSLWFSHLAGTIGIVIGEDDLTKERKAFIGLVAGNNEEMDSAWVLDRGSHLSRGTLQEILLLLKTTPEGKA